MAYYRTDILKEAGLEPPKTWDDYLAIAETLQRQGPERRRQGRLRLLHRQEAQRPGLLVHHLDRRQLHPDPGHGPGRLLRHRDHGAADQQRGASARRSRSTTRPTKYGPPDEINLDVGDTRGLFTSGRCALTIDWGDIGTLAIDPTTSKVQDKVGRGDHARLQTGARPRHRQARRLRRDHLPERHRRRQPRAVRGIRRLGGCDQRGQGPEDQGRGLRLHVLHERSPSSPTRTSPSASRASIPTGSRSSRTTTCGSRPG